MQISVIIVSYNVKHYLRQCIRSVWASAKGLDVEVFVVDNNSKDGSVDYIRKSFPQMEYPGLHVIANRCNVGFGRANNAALRKAKGEYILFLNPDTIITENTLMDCYEYAKRQKSVGAIGVRMLSASGNFAKESRRGLPTPWVSFCKMSGLCTMFPKSRIFGRYYMQYLNEQEPAEIDVVSGAFMFCSHEALNKCGSFDEEFFMYGEDIDLSYRFVKEGFHNWYLPTNIVHYKGESTYKGDYRYVHIFYEAMLIFFKKNFPSASLFLSVPVNIAILMCACLALIKQKLAQFAHFINPSSGHTIFRMCFWGVDENNSELEELIENWSIDVGERKADYITFDGEKASYQEIINALEKSGKELGVYYPTERKIILPKTILQ